MNEPMLRNGLDSTAQSDEETVVPERRYTKIDKTRSSSNAWQVILLENQSKVKNTQKKSMLLIGILSIFSLAVIFEGFFCIRWLIFSETQDYVYWANMLSIEEICSDSPQSSDAISTCQQTNQEVYSTLISDFFADNCDDETDQDPTNLCNSLVPYRIAGIVASCGIWLAMLLHLFSILQFLKLTSHQGNLLISYPAFQKILLAIVLLYTISVVEWIISSIFVTKANTQTPFINRLGFPFYMTCGSMLVYFVLAYWFRRILAAGAKMEFISSLLTQGTQYIEEVEGL